jgi:hypothetical protein
MDVLCVHPSVGVRAGVDVPIESALGEGDASAVGAVGGAAILDGVAIPDCELQAVARKRAIPIRRWARMKENLRRSCRNLHAGELNHKMKQSN